MNNIDFVYIDTAGALGVGLAGVGSKTPKYTLVNSRGYHVVFCFGA